MEKKFSVKEFVDKYNSKSSKQLKDIFIKSVIVNDYVDYAKKISVCGAVIEQTSYITDPITDSNAISKNSPFEYMLFMMTLIDLYTTISVREKGDMLEDFDLLDQYDLIDELVKAMPESEIRKMNTVFKMKKGDFYENNENMVVYLRSLAAGLEHVLQSVTETATNMMMERKDELMDAIMKAIQEG